MADGSPFPLVRLHHLTAAQKRHLAEMHVDPLDPPMVWTTKRDSPQNRSARALVKKGLLERVPDYSTFSFNYPAFVLTEKGRAVAKELAT